MSINRHTTLLLTLLALLGSAAHAAEITPAGDSSLGFQLSNRDSSITGKYHLSRAVAIEMGLGYSTFGSEDAEGPEFEGRYDQRSDTTTTSALGLRYYFSAGALSWFSSASGQLIYQSSEWEHLHYTETHDDDVTQTEDGVGFGVNVSLGAEQFITPQFSIEGKVGFAASRVELEGEKVDAINMETTATSRLDYRSSTFSALGVNFYW